MDTKQTERRGLLMPPALSWSHIFYFISLWNAVDFMMKSQPNPQGEC